MSSSLDLPADLIAELRSEAKDADIAAARAFGFGGSNWDAGRPSGVGTGARTLQSIGTVQALAYRQKPGTLGMAAGGTPVLADVWRLIVIEGALRPGDVIRSQTDMRYAFDIGSIEPWYDYKRAELGRVRGDVTIVGSVTDPLLDDDGQPLLGES